MTTVTHNPSVLAKIIQAQETELTECLIYEKLAANSSDPKTKNILLKIANQEREHYDFWLELSGKEVKPNGKKIRKYLFLTRLFGLGFAIKLMEKEEIDINLFYQELLPAIPEVERIMQEEKSHEQELTDLIGADRLQYISSIILGLNDALIEFTGGLAGWTLALRKPKLIALVAIILGIAAALSMAVSEYLSTKAEKSGKNPLKAAAYTGAAYLVAVIILVLPYLLLDNALISLGVTIALATMIIFSFSFYASVTQHDSFRKKFTEMFSLSMGVAGFSFAIGYLLRRYFDIEV